MSRSLGPWRIVRASEYTDDPEDTKIMSVKAADGATIIYTDSGYFEPKEDDAALVVIAPDMLRLCRRLVDRWGNGNDEEAIIAELSALIRPLAP